jgi:subtilisin family serine protease
MKTPDYLRISRRRTDVFQTLVYEDDTMKTELQSEPTEPIYTIPPCEREAELTVSRSHLQRVLAESRDWGHELLGIPELHASGIKGEGVKVAVLDTGLASDHPDLKASVSTTGHKDFTGSSYLWRDVQNHGSHCGGIVAAAENDDGLVGVAPKAKITAVKVLGDNGSGPSSSIAAGIRHAADTGHDILSMSLGSSSPDT